MGSSLLKAPDIFLFVGLYLFQQSRLNEFQREDQKPGLPPEHEILLVG